MNMIHNLGQVEAVGLTYIWEIWFEGSTRLLWKCDPFIKVRCLKTCVISKRETKKKKDKQHVVVMDLIVSPESTCSGLNLQCLTCFGDMVFTEAAKFKLDP